MVFPRMVFIASAALFPIMALFIWLDVYRYRVYLPLFLAGKCISLFLLLVWYVITRQIPVTEEFLSGFISSIGGEWIFLFCDCLAVLAVLIIFENVQKLTERPALTDAPDMEDK